MKKKTNTNDTAVLGNGNFFEALSTLVEENNVAAETLIEKVKIAMLKAARKAYPHSEENIRIEIDPSAKKFDMFIEQEIIDDYPIDENEVNIEVAKIVDPNAVVGGKLLKKIDISKLGRMAALSAKQSIRGDLRDISREKMLKKFEPKEHECLSVKVSQVEEGNVTVLYEGTELYLSKSEQIPGEKIEVDDIIKVYITGITNKNKKPFVKISRKHKDLVKRLFELEIPEIYEGVVEIKEISREAGSRTKIAVWSNDPNVDAIGACIGEKRSRITAIVNELNGEKIDLIPYSENPEEFIANALAPAQVLKTILLPESNEPVFVPAEENAKGKPEKKTPCCIVIVPNNQYSLAIGNKGQNAKLAAKLTNYKIDIKPQFDAVTGEEAPELKADFKLPSAADEADDTDIFTDDSAEPEMADDVILFDDEEENTAPAASDEE